MLGVEDPNGVGAKFYHLRNRLAKSGIALDEFLVPKRTSAGAPLWEVALEKLL